ncbi:putative LRR receptor-like serine/threonine-protein kinase MRH1-like [Capsicum annuum]|nr:putative LRR receptor-like serine/threonine-protein kinase MRH1-like [Capsicum annuum]
MVYACLFRSAYVGMKIGLNVMFVYNRMDALSVCEVLVALPYDSDKPRAVWNPPLTRRGSPQPECTARVGVSDSDIPHDTRPVRGKRAPQQADDSLSTTKLERISYYEMIKVTDDLSESNLLGSGSFGSVYKRVLNSGTTLVLDYMPNGSLEMYLYSHNYFLNTRQRLSIMIDVACALEYLHHGCSSAVIHRDLKPSNVFLDENMVAHLSNFGISKQLGEGQGDFYTKTLATLGYIAPEYGLEGLVSTKCDVYSYGVMLLETFTRRKPNEFEGDLSLTQWISYSLPDVVMDIVDDNLVKPMGKGLQKELDVVTSIMKVALDCGAESPARRTNMKDVVGMLQKIKIQLLAC